MRGYFLRWLVIVWFVLIYPLISLFAQEVPVGGPCIEASDCTGTDPSCADSLFGFADGYCYTANCESDSCPDGAGCFFYQEGEGQPFQMCLDLCSAGDPCRDGYHCLAGACWSLSYVLQYVPGGNVIMQRLDQKNEEALAEGPPEDNEAPDDQPDDPDQDVDDIDEVDNEVDVRAAAVGSGCSLVR